VPRGGPVGTEVEALDWYLAGGRSVRERPAG
jgi:hypothetical protein